MSDAKRFSGTYSKDAPKASSPKQPPRSPFSGRKASGFSWRVLGLYLAPSVMVLPLLYGLISAQLTLIMQSCGIYALMMFGAWMTGQGLKAEAAFTERLIAKPPAFPRKLFGAAMIGLGVAGALFLGEKGLGPLAVAFYGALAVGAHLYAFGLDPMKAKGVVSHDGADVSHVFDRLEEAEHVVDATVVAARQLGDHKLEARVDSLAFAARDILREVQADPRDFRRARRFLSVHLVGLRDATEKYVKAKAKGAADMRAEYDSLLTDLEASFAKQRETLLTDDRIELEIEIEVLRDRLKEENLR